MVPKHSDSYIPYQCTIPIQLYLPMIVRIFSYIFHSTACKTGISLYVIQVIIKYHWTIAGGVLFELAEKDVLMERLLWWNTTTKGTHLLFCPGKGRFRSDVWKMEEIYARPPPIYGRGEATIPEGECHQLFFATSEGLIFNTFVSINKIPTHIFGSCQNSHRF